MIYPVIGMAMGICIGIIMPDLSVSPDMAKLLATALLACLDSVFGGIRATLNKNFNNRMFLVGFFSNAFMAAIFVFVGLRLGIDLYFVVLITFGMRIFQNMARIRRKLLVYKPEK